MREVTDAAVGGRWKQGPSLSGLAIALTVHGAIFLAFDPVAERRGATELAAREQPNPS